MKYGNSTRHFKRDLVTASGVPIPTSPLTYDTISPIMNPDSPPTPSSSASTSTAPGPTTSPSNADLTIGEKAGISAGVVVGACGIGVLILLLIRRRGNGYNHHDGHGDKKEGYPEPQLLCSEHELPEESTRVEMDAGPAIKPKLPEDSTRAEMDAVPAMQKIHELPPAENAQVCSVTEAPSADHLSVV